MIKIRKKNTDEYLELRQNTNLNLNKNSNFFHDSGGGEYSFSIEVDATQNNIRFFSFANQLNKANRVRKMAVWLYINDVLQGEYTLFLNSVSTDSFSFNLQKGNNFLIEACKDLSLRDVDFGSLAFASTTPQTVWATDTIAEKFQAIAKEYENAETVFWVFWIEDLPTEIGGDAVWLDCKQDFTNTTEQTLQALANKINSGAYSGTAGFTATAHPTAIAIVPPPAYTPFYAVFNTLTTAQKTATGGLAGVDTYNFATTTNSKALILPKYASVMFPRIYNPDFYDKDKFADWGGYINNIEGGYIKTNSLIEAGGVNNTAVPFVRVGYMLNILSSFLGIVFEGDLMTDADWQELYMYSNKSLDEKDNTVQFEYSKTKRTIQIADYLPDIKIIDFFAALADLGFFYDIVEEADTVKAKMIWRNTVLNSLSQNADFFFEKLEIDEPASFELDFEGDLNYERNPQFQKFEKIIVSNPDANKIENINLRFGTMHTDGAALYDIEEGNSTMYENENEKEIPLRFVFFVAQTNDYIIASHTRNAKSLLLTGISGIYSRAYASYLAQRKNGEWLNAKIKMNTVKLQNLKMYQPFFYENACYVLASLSLRITNNKDSLQNLHDAKLLKIN